MDFYITLFIGIFIGITLTIWAEFFGTEKNHIKQIIKNKLPHKMASFEGESDEQAQFSESLKQQENIKIK